jgi:uncharacterized RDD family membrane protein YckC
MSRSNLALRAGAFALDYLVIAAYLLVLGGAFAVLRIVLPEMSAALLGSPISGQVTGFLVLTLPVTLYFAFSEASDHQGTVGKRRLGLRVVGIDGHRISLPRSVARSGAKFAPWELAHACIGRACSPGRTRPQSSRSGSSRFTSSLARTS